VDSAGAGHEHARTVPAVQRNNARVGLHAWQRSFTTSCEQSRVFHEWTRRRDGQTGRAGDRAPLPACRCRQDLRALSHAPSECRRSTGSALRRPIHRLIQAIR
jgi:hypothetical protein